MEVKLNRKNDAFHFEAKGDSGYKVSMDASPQIGGENLGNRPMELLLMAVGGCSSIDLGLILKKQRQHLEDYQVVVSGERKTDDSKAFKSIHLNFTLFGDLDSTKVEKALELTVKKYCSVILSLSSDIEINYEFTIKSHE